MQLLSLNRRGFTLVELLIVITVISILVGMLFPAIAMVRKSAAKTNCAGNQAAIVLEMILYTQEYRRWPDAGAGAGADRGARSQELLLGRLKDNRALFTCPMSPTFETQVQALKTPNWTTAGTSYGYDFETPIDAKPVKTVLADRISGGVSPHGKTAVSINADGSINTIRLNGSNWPNTDAGDANIFSYPASPNKTMDANLR